MSKRMGWTASIASALMLVGFLGAPRLSNTYAAEREERHPKIHAAVESLRAAKEELKGANHDFGGHRKEALEAVEKALHQLELARDFDKK